MTPQDQLYEEAVAAHAPALERLARSYELDPEKRRDLLQDIHLALWRSFAGFEGQCSPRTWMYRVAHNVAATHVARHQRQRSRELVSLDDIDAVSVDSPDRRIALDHLYALIHRLKPIEREVILLYLEGFDAASIGEITGISAANAATRIHRIKKILAARFHEGDHHAR